MKMIHMDLHMHSSYSDDGEYLPSTLMHMCKESGMQVVALADHNSIKAIPEAKKVADELGMDYIPAIELDCNFQGINLHHLGYGIDYQNKELSDACAKVEKMEQGCSNYFLPVTILLLHLEEIAK